MSTEAQSRVDAATLACHKSLEHWRKAVDALGTNVSVNGVGVLHDRYAFRQRLVEAQASIQASVAALDAVHDWPSSADYDQI